MVNDSPDPQPVGVMTFAWADLPAEHRLACAELWQHVWPLADGSGVAGRLAAMESTYDDQHGLQLHLAIADTSLMAVARTFLHTVALGREPLDIVALASVCSHPAHRGKGWGDAVVHAAFERAAATDRPALFQSPVPEYYERFGSRAISNEITTSVVGAKPFTDPFAMIHPGDTPWNNVPMIDLKAPGW